MALIVLIIYCVALLYIILYCLLQFHLLYYYQRHRSMPLPAPTPLPHTDNALPLVTIQLPIFNELYVVERLIDNITSIDYPRNRMEIQVLDDSTDETLNISRRKVAEYQQRGYNIELLHRTDRTGYKAGALKAALPHARGKFVAIFDADFLPRPDFLKGTIPYFLANQKVGVVQTRWEHINENYSMLTRLQAMQLNVHFTVEQQGRKAGNCLLQFNGTAGIWRRSTIEDAGGWEADTLTEDLDLSYRAQLRGWEIVYLEGFASPAELPAEINGLKSQQFRWMKGGAENARKLLPTIWRSELSLRQKIHASGHLLASGVFVFIFIAGVFSVPLIFAIQELSVSTQYFWLFFVGLFSIIAVYYTGNVQAEFNKGNYIKVLVKFLLIFPVFLALSMGLSLHNTVAVIQGYMGKRSPFIRTPKFNIQGIRDSFKNRKYLTRRISWTTIMEGFMFLYFCSALAGGMYLGNNPFMIFHLMMAIGFGGIFFYSVRHLAIR